MKIMVIVLLLCLQPLSASALAQALECEPGAGCREPVTGMAFVWMPGGCFRMGCDTRGGVEHACEPDERPVREVCVSGFWLAETELTRSQLARLRGQSEPAPDEATLPATDISWHDAKKLMMAMRRLTGPNLRPRLPTEAEWEYACTAGGTVGPYSFGLPPEIRGWEQANSQGKAHPVAQNQANPLGIYDMSGNVWEWCEDAFHFTAYSYLGKENPRQSRDTGRRVRRGGSFRYCTTCMRCSNRKSAPAEDRMDDIGLRMVLEVVNQ
ncbi:MAG: formylglycine-generating enzyme family protein [Humidesulfovibrio sp.]|uniref:formylglycine-generating enzyme family protein n=1 Tax=Humidesulfovibrio sp. TaxID=2910988 RepID=UPI0027F89544|nr:formylglycine-generating enzyme family protein [Humidesulfovibrio sp.]MDQ7834008.1 formylglycine-generating enzyme family protein [Humidesulfovibrio sp.]